MKTKIIFKQAKTEIIYYHQLKDVQKRVFMHKEKDPQIQDVLKSKSMIKYVSKSKWFLTMYLITTMFCGVLTIYWNTMQDSNGM